MKNSILILFLVFTSVSQCQDANIMTLVEYDNIEINGIKLGDIKNTHGLEIEMENLLGIPVNNEINADGYFSRYFYDGFRISFSSVLSGKVEHILGSFHITNNNYNITIQGITVTIGDNISALGNVVFNIDNDGNQSILYMHCNGCNNFIAIDFNQLTGQITEIFYIELT